MFLEIIVILMAAALVLEVVSLVGLALLARRVTRYVGEFKGELSDIVKPSVELAKAVIPPLRPLARRTTQDAREIVNMVVARYQVTRTVWRDAGRRAQRLRLRLGREGVATVEQLQHGRRVLSRGVITPVRAATTLVLGMRSAAWLLKRVA